MEPEVDGITQGLVLATSAAPSAIELVNALENLPGGVVVIDRNGRPLMTNHAARALLGGSSNMSFVSIDIAVSDGMRDARTGVPIAPEATPLVRALHGETIAGEEYTFSRAENQTPLRLRVSGIPLRGMGGRITGAMSVFTDVTAEIARVKRAAQLVEVGQRARAEADQVMAHLQHELAERRGAADALLSSQHRLRLALEASHMVTWDYDVLHDHIEWSAEMSPFVGALPPELTGSLASVLAYVHPEDRDSVEQAVHEALERGRNLQVEMRILHGPDHRLRWLLAKGRVSRDEQGCPLRVTGVAVDITERKEAAAARSSMAHGERLRVMGEMASGIAHDLNQSLALITGYSEIAHQELNQPVPDTSRVREAVEITARAALEGGQALRGLLSFVGAQDPTPARVDLAEVLHDAARLTAPRWRHASQAEGRPIELTVDAERECAITGSGAALREAIINLIFNAVDALPRGGAIHLAAFQRDGQVVVEVADTGTGIPADVRARVFDPFFTTKGASGTGLGLSQVLAIVKRHGGAVEVSSEPGRGTTFLLTFPRATTGPSAPREQAPKKDLAASPGAIRILVVEDEQQLARMASLVLTQRGHQVTVAPSGDKALERLQHESFDLVISDLGLGSGKNGWDLAGAVREHWPGTRFVLVTGWGAGIDPGEARARGVHQVIAKPYRIDDLRRVADDVAECLGKR